MIVRKLHLPTRLRRLRRDRRGTVAIEFGFALPVLILLTVGLIDFSILLWRTSTVENAASEGARYAAVHGAASSAPATPQQVQDFIRGQAAAIPSSDLNISVTWQPNNQPGSKVTVDLTYNHTFLVAGLIGLGPISIEKTSLMTIF